jgi:hypothetical protein
MGLLVATGTIGSCSECKHWLPEYADVPEWGRCGNEKQLIERAIAIDGVNSRMGDAGRETSCNFGCEGFAEKERR